MSSKYVSPLISASVAFMHGENNFPSREYAIVPERPQMIVISGWIRIWNKSLSVPDCMFSTVLSSYIRSSLPFEPHARKAPPFADAPS